jgi:hypothetical protein
MKGKDCEKKEEIENFSLREISKTEMALEDQ